MGLKSVIKLREGGQNPNEIKLVKINQPSSRYLYIEFKRHKKHCIKYTFCCKFFPFFVEKPRR